MRYAVLSIACLMMALASPITLSAQTAKVAPQSIQRSRSFPNNRKVEAKISRYLEKLPDRQETDLLSRGEILPLFEILADIGWDVSDRKDIESQLLEDTDWLVSALRTTSGTKFMRKIGGIPGGYAQLDLMRQSSQGKKEVDSLIKTPGGEELIKLLATTEIGRKTSQQLVSSRHIRLKPEAPRLYTKADVYKQLKVSYTAEAERRAKSAAILERTSTQSKSTDSAPPVVTAPQPLTPTAPAEASSPDVD